MWDQTESEFVGTDLAMLRRWHAGCISNVLQARRMLRDEAGARRP